MNDIAPKRRPLSEPLRKRALRAGARLRSGRLVVLIITEIYLVYEPYLMMTKLYIEEEEGTTILITKRLAGHTIIMPITTT